jgi:cobalt/nickel transport system permease protein
MGALPWAVHISDGVLTGPWLLAGFVVMVLLMLPACWRVRDEEIPRIALLTAAFFVASLIHIRIGPTTAHLLLNGLVGVVLGRRAAVAIPIGLFLQAVFLGHGGISTLGINACVMTLPALAACGLFRVLRGPAVFRHSFVRSLVVFVSALAWLYCLVFSTALLFSNRLTSVAQLYTEPALRLSFHPAVVVGASIVALGVVWLERRERTDPEFSVGLVLGLFSVLATATLNAIVLWAGGQEDWRTIVLLVFVTHLPIAAFEGIVLGFTVSFLAKVKPEMLGEYEPAPNAPRPEARPLAVLAEYRAAEPAALSRKITPPFVLLLSLLTGLAVPGSARAHRLEAEYRILADGRVQIESWFDLTGDSPQGATVQVFRADGQLVLEGKLDDKGLFSFESKRSEALRVVVAAGAGHRKELLIPKAATTGDAPDAAQNSAGLDDQQSPFADRSTRVTIKDIVAGFGFVFGLAAFLLSMRNTQQLRQLKNSQSVESKS